MHIYPKFIKENASVLTLIFTIIASSITTVIWMNDKFNKIDIRLVKLETVLIMQHIMPDKLVICQSKPETQKSLQALTTETE